MRTQPEQNIFHAMTSTGDGPAFLRRERETRDAWESLLHRAGLQYERLLTMPKLRLRQLAMSCPVWVERCRSEFGELNAASLRQFAERWQILGEAPVSTMQTERFEQAARGVRESFLRFNTRWLELVRSLDFDAVNQLRREYNRWYVVEKE